LPRRAFGQMEMEGGHGNQANETSGQKSEGSFTPRARHDGRHLTALQHAARGGSARDTLNMVDALTAMRARMSSSSER